MLFADGELFYDLTLYTERTSPPLCTLLHTAPFPSAHAGAKRSGGTYCYSVTERQQGEKKSPYISCNVEIYECCHWLGVPYDHRSLVLGPVEHAMSTARRIRPH